MDITIPSDDPDLGSSLTDLKPGDAVTLQGTVGEPGENGTVIAINEVMPAEAEENNETMEEGTPPAPPKRPRAPKRAGAVKSPTDFAIAQRNKRMGRSSMPGNMPMSGAGY